jgi:hypothetical protein
VFTKLFRAKSLPACAPITVSLRLTVAPGRLPPPARRPSRPRPGFWPRPEERSSGRSSLTLHEVPITSWDDEHEAALLDALASESALDRASLPELRFQRRYNPTCYLDEGIGSDGLTELEFGDEVNAADAELLEYLHSDNEELRARVTALREALAHTLLALCGARTVACDRCRHALALLDAEERRLG